MGAGKQWAVVMSRCNEYKDQVIELDFLYPSEGIHRRWDEGKQCCINVCSILETLHNAIATGAILSMDLAAVQRKVGNSRILFHC